MSYIDKKKRERLDNGSIAAIRSGELNYLITKLCLDYLEINGIDYQTYNDIIGALESCKLEFYRRSAVPHEENKIKLNGDIY